MHRLEFFRREKTLQVAENTKRMFANVGRRRWNRKRLRKYDKIASAGAVLEDTIFGEEHELLYHWGQGHFSVTHGAQAECLCYQSRSPRAVKASSPLLCVPVWTQTSTLPPSTVTVWPVL